MRWPFRFVIRDDRSIPGLGTYLHCIVNIALPEYSPHRWLKISFPAAPEKLSLHGLLVMFCDHLSLSTVIALQQSRDFRLRPLLVGSVSN